MALVDIPKQWQEAPTNPRMQFKRGAHVSLVSPSLHFPRHYRLRAWVLVWGLVCGVGLAFCCVFLFAA